MAAKFDELRSLYDGTKEYEKECLQRLVSAVKQIFQYIEWPARKSATGIQNKVAIEPPFWWAKVEDIGDSERSIGNMQNAFMFDPSVGLGHLRARICASVEPEDPRSSIFVAVFCELRSDGKWVIGFADAVLEANPADNTLPTDFMDKAFSVLKNMVAQRYPRAKVSP